ncbi:hypothetical protein G4V62_16790 [Bacillaceae bacterium SIJ1]|nr:hypothetical protein [Litoribacterium kuwaitense]
MSRQAFEDSAEFQLFRIQQNIKDIAKEGKQEVLGLEQDKYDEWVVVSRRTDGLIFEIRLNSCKTSYRGQWDFMLTGEYTKEGTLWIGDIKGEVNQGFGSICMAYLKEQAEEYNAWRIEGDLAKRDWGHLDRLIHFYQKHGFDVQLDEETYSGSICWRPSV